MANAKRQRQDDLRSVKVQQQQAELEKQQKTAKRNRYLKLGLPLIAVVGVLLVWPMLRSGKSSKSTTASDTTASTEPTTTTTTLPVAISSKPVITVPAGDPPKELQIKDLVVGTGPEAVAGSSVDVNYSGVAWSTKKEFDSSWGRGPFAVVSLGSGGVIEGWSKGLIGMKQGGRRQLIIPPAMAYGTTGAGADIKANETLIFVVDALSVTAPTASTK